VLVLAAVVAAGTAVAGWLFDRSGGAGVAFTVRRYSAVAADGVTVEVEVARPPGTAVTCLALARAHDGAEIGRETFVVPPSRDRTVVVRHRIRTTRTPATAEVVRCYPNSTR